MALCQEKLRTGVLHIEIKFKIGGTKMDLKSILNDEEINFLKDFAHELKTQDRGGTNKPVYYSIWDRKTRFDSDDSDGFDTVNIFDNDGEKLETLEDLQEHIINNPFEFEIENFNEEDIRKYDIDEIVAIYKKQVIT